jgi:hypothetical protein
MAGFTEQEQITKMTVIPSAISEEINRFMDDTNLLKDFDGY